MQGPWNVGASPHAGEMLVSVKEWCNSQSQKIHPQGQVMVVNGSLVLIYSPMNPESCELLLDSAWKSIRAGDMMLVSGLLLKSSPHPAGAPLSLQLDWVASNPSWALDFPATAQEQHQDSQCHLNPGSGNTPENTFSLPQTRSLIGSLCPQRG